MTPVPPSTLVHSRRNLTMLSIGVTLGIIVIAACIWAYRGRSYALPSAAAFLVYAACHILPAFRTRLRYGPGLPLDYRPPCGRTRIIPLDTILSWYPGSYSRTFSVSPVPFMVLTIRTAPDASPRPINLIVPGTRSDYEHFFAFLSSHLLPSPPSAP